MKRFTILLLSAALITASCNQRKAEASDSTPKDLPTFDLATAKAEISGSNEAFTKAVVAGDSAAVHNMYHSEAKVYPANAPALEGLESIASFFAYMPKMGVKTMKLQTADVFGGPTDVVETGTYEIGDGTHTIDKGKYLVVWRMEDGKWKNYRDIWNSDMPPPTAKK